MRKVTIDGNQAASNIAYMFNDAAFIYPITPSSQMAENCDQYAYEGKKNIFDNKLVINQMQSEAGVAGALHGSLIAGAKTTTFTSSQGLLLMLPNMYKIAGEGLPCVIYVSARSVATHALNIFCDYSDIYACMKTGFNIINCSSVQEVNDIAIACELASIQSSTPFICFFDGFRTSHELNTIYQTELDDLKKIVDFDAIARFKARAMNNHNPFVAGTNQNPDVFMQNRVASLERYSCVIDEVKSALLKQSKITKRMYDTVEYYGDSNAKDVVVCMGTAADVVRDVVSASKSKIGVMKIRLLKPFDAQTFMSKLPKGVKNITILERNLDVNGVDCLASFVMSVLHKHDVRAKCYTGCYGLGGKEFTPSMAKAVFDNMRGKKREFFTLGIYDNVTHTSLEVENDYKENNSDFSMRVYGIGSDGSVSSVKNTIKILGEETTAYVQGYSEYDSKKSGSLTISHMRSSFLPINAPYNPQKVDLVVCNNIGFIEKYDITECLRDKGVLLLNSSYDFATLDRVMPYKMKQDLVNKKIRLFSINANAIAREHKLGAKINTIMQTALFKVSELLPFEIAYDNIKRSIERSYGKKGQGLVDANIKAIAQVSSAIKEINPKRFTIRDVLVCSVKQSEYYENIIVPTSNQKGGDIPVSRFCADGRMPTDTAKFEKRALATNLPEWISEKCIQCGRCALVCPHAALRPVIVDEKKRNPKSFVTKKAFGTDGNYRMQVNTLDCTGCGVCVESCPVKALIMREANEIRDSEVANMEYMNSLPNKAPFGSNSVKGVQFKQPYFEFSGACAGCGETPYVKLMTQLFGDRMLIANATGCSSIYGATYPVCPYSKDKEGFGPSWANSLFEDNAEFGYGIAVARRNERSQFIDKLKSLKLTKKLGDMVAPFIQNTEDHEYNKRLVINLKEYKKTHIIKGEEKYLYDNISLITSPSMWIVGGDGWAYDIGFGGLDHVVASGENVNILILDTEVYSNTGGQTSKSTPRGASAKFNLTGKTTKKKDLASMLLTYKDVYVAQVSMSANPEQCVQAFIEAEKYNGPSVIIAYSPCVNHGYDMTESQNHTINAVKSGYTTLFRYNPTVKEKMSIDSFDPIMKYSDYVNSENRYEYVGKVNKNKTKLIKQSEKDAAERREAYKKLKN